MKSRVIKVFIIVSVLLSFSHSSAQIFIPDYRLYSFTVSMPLRDYDFLGSGARARGLGGAFLAVSDDASAGSWNPAGLVQLDKIQTSFSLLTSSFNNQYENSFSSYTFEKTKSTINYASFVLPFKLSNRGFVASAIFNQAASLRDNYTIPADSSGHFYRNELDGRLNYAAITAAGKLFSGISLGTSVNIYAGTFINSKYQDFAKYGTPPDDTLITAHPFNRGSYSGANLSFGLMYQRQKMRLAAIVKTPFTLKETDDVQWLFDFTVRGVTNPPPIGPQNGSFLYKTIRKWKIPASWGLGASYSVSDNLLVALDLETRYQGKLKFLYQVNVLDPVSPYQEISIKDLSLTKMTKIGNHTTQFRLGGEYVVSSFKQGKLSLRGGYRNQPKILVPSTEVRGDSTDARAIFRDPAQIKTDLIIRDGTLSGNVYTLGFGWARAQIKLDLGVEFNRWKIENSGLIYMDPLSNPPGNTYTFTETNNYNLTRYIFNFTGYF